MSAEIADVLGLAADRIERDGWYQGSYYEGYESGTNPGVALRCHPQPCCVLGAISAESTEGCWLADQALLDFVGGSISLDRWNDAPERTQAEVVAALRGAAEQERGAS